MPYITSRERLGLKRGRQEGRQEGMATLVLRLLKHRFGELEPELEERIAGLSSRKLETFGDALLDFSTLAEVKEWLQAKRW